MANDKKRLDHAPLEALVAEVAAVEDEVDGLNVHDNKREADYHLGLAITSVKKLRKLTTPGA